MQLTEHTMKSWDGAELFYRAWTPAKPTGRAVLLFHRGHEHSGRWTEMVEALGLEDCCVFAWDQRGHGHSAGERGHAPNLADVIKDADVFAGHICRTHGVTLDNTVVMAHSVGAVIAAAWVHDYGPPIRGMILAVPAFRVRLYVPLAIPALRLKQKFIGAGFVKSYVKAKMLTHDPEQAAAYQRDPLIFRQIAVNILLDLHDTATRLLADAGAITVPTLILAAEKDWVVTVAAQQNFYERLGSPIKQFDLILGSFHAIFQETGREKVIARARDFLLDCFSWPRDKARLLDADKGGHTRTEYDLLRVPGGLRWSLIRAWVKTGGRLSRGVQIGWKSGFDSGVMLDYVYENKSHGPTPLQKLSDRFFLDSLGWWGIRLRRENLEKVLRRSIEELHGAGRRVCILDVASGPGRYVLETMRAMAAIPITAVLRDYKQENLDAARLIAERLGINHVTIAQGDAFDRDSLAAVEPRPTIAIVSGLYELFPDNAPVRRSLEGIAAALEEGGYLIYTCQPWHPQVEFIARVLTNREGRPWIMRRRTQAEMDELVRAAGFEKISQEIDWWGIFSVSVAKRVTR